MRGTALAAVACAAVACTVAACTGGSVASTAQQPVPGPGGSSQKTFNGTAGLSHPAAAWPTFNQNAARTGVAAGLPAAGQLTRRWNDVLDGAVYGQPIVVGGLVIAATENDTVYALNSATGRLVWRNHLGTPVKESPQHGCGDVFPLGITSTPAYDQVNGIVYAAGEISGYHHVLFGLSVTDGALRVRRDIDVTTAFNDPAYDQQRAALTIANGRVYTAFGGLYGDCGQYRGMVVGVSVTGGGPLLSYQVPTSREGGIWGTAGPVAGPRGDLWVSTGNGASVAGMPYDDSDSVTILSPTLRRLSLFAPASWPQDNQGDVDLGSSQPVLAAGNVTFIMGKRGTGYLLNTPDLGGIGHQLAALTICAAYGAASVSGDTVYEPCASGGMAAISVDARQRTVGVLWQGPAASNGSPVVGGGAIWVTAFTDGGPGTLFELNPANGAVRSQLTIGDGLPHFASLSLAGAAAYLGTMAGVTAINGA